MKALYPAIFTFDECDETFPKGSYLVEFPDFNGCYTFGETIEEAYNNAEDVLNLVLYVKKEQKGEIPKASFIMDIKCNDKSFVSLVKADTRVYYKKYKHILNRKKR